MFDPSKHLYCFATHHSVFAIYNRLNDVSPLLHVATPRVILTLEASSSSHLHTAAYRDFATTCIKLC